MTSQRNIWLAAKAMIQRYGSNAAMEAAQRTDDALEGGDTEGSTT